MATPRARRHGGRVAPVRSTGTTEAFWVVWGRGQGEPTVEHRNRAKANSEAERLARENPGVQFTVLRAERTFLVRAPLSVTDHVSGDFR